MADASQNKPGKETMYALIGIVALLAIIALIAISAFLRPAGDHVVVEEEADGETVEVVESEAPTDATATEAEEIVVDGAPTDDAPAAYDGEPAVGANQTGDASDEAQAKPEDVATEKAVEENVLPPENGEPIQAPVTEEIKEAAEEKIGE